MSLLTEALTVTTRAGGTCGVRRLMDRLSESEQAELREALTAPVQSKALSKALSNRGHDLPPQTIGRHRRGDCTCDR